MTMRDVKLYGHLGKTFGRVFRMDVATPAEAIRALRANLEGFEQYLSKHSAPGYHVVIEKRSLGKDDLALPCGSGTIKIIPAVAGAKRAGAFQTILGVVLVVVGAIMQAYGIPVGSALIKLGVTLIVGGVTQMLNRPPTRSTSERPENAPSYTFNGPVNTTTQGNPVPVCYGEMIVGSQVASFGLDVDDIFIPTHTGVGGGDGEPGPGSGAIDGSLVTTIGYIDNLGIPQTWNHNNGGSIYVIDPFGDGDTSLGNLYSYNLSLTQGMNTLNITGAQYDKITNSFTVDGGLYPGLSSFTAGAGLTITGGIAPVWTTSDES